jgi:diguanylate cyclase (GGDEF)-like protein/PAS domain S-box-containing protein
MSFDSFYISALSILSSRDNLAIYIKDKDLRYVYCSEQYAKLIGVSPSSFLYNKTDKELFTASNAQTNHNEDSEVVNRKRFISHTSPYIGGTVVQETLVRKEPLLNEKKEVIGLMCILQNLNPDSRMPDSHHERELLEESGNLGTWKLELRTFKLSLSNGLYYLFGYSNFPHIDMNAFLDFTHSDDRKIYETMLLDAIQTQKNITLERRIINILGEEKVFVEKIFVQYDLDQKPITMFSIIRDYTQIRKYEKIIFEQNLQLENALRQKTDELFDVIQHKNRLLLKYQAFLDSFGEIAYERNLVEDSFRWNGDLEKVLGYSIMQMPKTWTGYLEMVHPDDRENLILPSNNIKKSKYGMNLEYRLLSKSGEYRWILDKGLYIFDKDEPIELLGIIRDIHDVKSSELKMKELAFRDDLTGLYNRRGVFQLLETNFYQAQRYGLQMELYYCDLNDFKRINDELGHDTGDAALVDFANILRKTLRKSDVVGRVGGDEFIFFSVNMEPKLESNLESRIHKAIDDFNNSLSRPYKLSFSLGRVEYDSLLHVTPDDIIAEADFTMYQNKRTAKTNN